ncbi:MAG TPA: hypothetical protein VEC02_04990 [Nitrososphaerales archaeon]|nr:hypothetical protein [Nitrososphaerales archaeon]
MPTTSAGKPLSEKLGIKSGKTVVILNAPSNYLSNIGKLQDVTVDQGLKGESDFIQYFATDRAVLEKDFPVLKESLSQNGTIWVTWPKGSKSRPRLNRDAVMGIGLANGLVDVKICSVDEVWSALKFVRRSADRRSAGP